MEFVHPGMHRDGPGWLARVNLPAGLEAVKVLDRRGGLSSALPGQPYSFLSSKLVREIAQLGGPLEGLVPSVVEERIRAKIA